MTQTAPARVMGILQASERLGISRRTVLRAIHAGELAATKTGPGTAGFVITVDELDRFAAERAGK